MKQRIIPIHRTLIEQLKTIQKKIEREGVCVHYLFESNYALINHLNNCSFTTGLLKYRKAAGIATISVTGWREDLVRTAGVHVCSGIHFEIEKEGIKYENASAFLAARLGMTALKKLTNI